MKQLGPRLGKIVSLIEPGFPVWDTCCDHGYIGIEIMARETSPQICFVDSSKTIIDSLKRKIEDSGKATNAKIAFFGIDAEKLDWEQVSGYVVVAGVGVDTIIKILEAIPEHRFTEIRLIMGPQNHPEKLKAYLLAKGIKFNPKNEWIVKEGKRFRHLFFVSPLP